jgi:hypothetical protein
MSRFQPVSLLPPPFELKLGGWPSPPRRAGSAGLRPPSYSTRHVPPADLEVKAMSKPPCQTKAVAPTHAELMAEDHCWEALKRYAEVCHVPKGDLPSALKAFQQSEIAYKCGNNDIFVKAALDLWRARQPYVGAPPGPAPTPAEVMEFLGRIGVDGQDAAEDAMGGIA